MKLKSIRIDKRAFDDIHFPAYKLVFTFDGGGVEVSFDIGDDALKVATELEWLATKIRNIAEVDKVINHKPSLKRHGYKIRDTPKREK